MGHHRERDENTRDDWQTPVELIGAIRAFAGGAIGLDPCAPPENNVGALYFYTEADDGLVKSWRNYGTVFV